MVIVTVPNDEVLEEINAALEALFAEGRAHNRDSMAESDVGNGAD